MPKFKNIRIPVGKKVKGKKRKTRLQRVQVLKSGKLKFVKNVVRGGGVGRRMARASPKRRRKSNPTNNKAPGMGATYQNAKLTAQVGGAFIREGITGSGRIDQRLGRAVEMTTSFNPVDGTRSASPTGHMKSIGVAVADHALSKHRLVRHANALSRGSVTAALPEVMALTRAAFAGSVDEAINEYGYSTMAGDTRGNFDFGDARFKSYMTTKYVGAGVRAIANRTKMGQRATAPIKKFLGAIGLGL